MTSSRTRLRLEQLEDRITPAPVSIGFGNDVHTFNVAGYNLHQNNSNHPTTSSAFGFADAQMTQPQQVTTLNGGLVNASLADAFDGALSFGLSPGGTAVSTTTYFDADGVVDITGNTITGDPNTVGTDGNSFGGLQLSQQNTILALSSTTPVIRSILTITNPTAAPITQFLGVFNNLGSDSSTTIFTTSSGDAVFDDNVDRWVGTFANFSPATGRSTDPRLLHVMQGPGTVESPFSALWNGNGDDNPNWIYNVTVGPGQTKRIMEFIGLYATRAQATTDGATFNSNDTIRSSGLLAGLTSQQLASIVNYDFDLADLAIVGSSVAPDPVDVGSDFTYIVDVTNSGPNDAQGAAVTYVLPATTTFVSASAPAGWTLSTPAVGANGTVIASTPSFASGTTARFTIVAKVNTTVADGTTISNTATASSTTPDPDGSNNSATVSTTAAVSADLAITKTDTPDPVNAGGNITYTLTVTNNGPSDAQSYLVSDVVQSPGMGIISFSHLSGPPAGGVLPAGATATFQVVVHVDATVGAGTNLVNSASVGSSTPDPNPNNNTGTATTTVITSADLAVTKVASPNPVTPGSTLTYTITLSNNGPSDAQAVSLTDGIPAGTTFVSATAPGGWTTTTPAVGGTGTVTFARASFAAGASPTFTVVVQVAAIFPAPAVSNTVTVSSTTRDSNTGNNSFTTNTAVSSPVDLVVTKTASPNPVVPGANLTYTVSVQNAGSLPAVNVKLYDILPDRTTFVSNSGAPGWTTTNPPVGSGGIITSTIPSFAGGATANFIIVVKVAGDARPGNVLTNRAVVSTSSFEINTSNNSTTFAVNVAAPPPVVVAVKNAAVTTTNSGGPSTKGVAPSPAITARDLVIASSSGLVADILRQKTLSGLLAFGG